MEQLKYYLGTGLRFEVIDPKFETGEYELSSIDLLGYVSLNGINVKTQSAELFHFEDVQFKMRPLSSLTKPITVEGYNGGEPFLPIDFFEVTDDHDTCPYEQDYGNIKLISKLKGIAEHSVDFDIKFLPHWVVEYLTSWHFWIGDQSEFGKSIIEIKE